MIVSRTVSELWKYRSLIVALIGRHLHSRYRGSLFGFLWSFLNPLCLIGVYSLVFRYYIRFDHIPHYSLFMFVGLLPWIWFSSGLLEATASISGGGNLITKAMFPPQVLPVVSVLTNLCNYLFALPLLLIFMFFSDMPLTWALLFLPVILFTQFLFLTGLSLGLSALNVHFRDVQHLLGNFMTLLFFLCPIIYPVTTIPEKLRFTVYLNPVALFTQMYQRVFLDGLLPELFPFLIAAGVSGVVFIAGCLIFGRYREEFAELI